jgi:hypothetical protein
MPKLLIDPGREKVAEDVLLMLQKKENMHSTTVRHVLKLACWLSSNRMGKRDRCPNWSVKAAERRRSWPNCPEGGEWPPNHGLIHEHIVPRKHIEDALYKLFPLEIENVHALLDLSEVCIVTECEDKRFGKNNLKQKMPPGCVLPRDKWKRYELVGIEREPHPASNSMLHATRNETGPV